MNLENRVSETIQSVPRMGGGGTFSPRLEVGFWAAASFLIGYYWMAPMSGRVGILHDYWFYALLPVFWLACWRFFIERLVDPLFALVGGYAIWCAIGVLWTGSGYEHADQQVLLWSMSAVTFVLAMSLLPTRLEVVRWIVLIGAGSAALASIVKFFLGHRYGQGELLGALLPEHPNAVAHYYGVAAILCWTRALRPGETARWIWIMGSALLSCAVLLTESRSASISLIVATTILWFVSLRGRRLWLPAALLAILFSALPATGFFQAGDAGRFFVYQEILDRGLEAPLIGRGIGASDDVQIPPGNKDFPDGRRIWHTHNVYLGAFLHGGLVGLGILAAILFVAGRRAVEMVRRGLDPTALGLLLFGTMAMAFDLGRPIYHPHNGVYVLLWLPIALVPTARALRKVSPYSTTGTSKPFMDFGLGEFSLFAVVPLLAQRALHLSGPLDAPQLMRQRHTELVFTKFYRNGIDLLHPVTAWMGIQSRSLAEMPIAEALVAILYHVSGPSTVAARSVFLVFFLASAWFLMLALQQLAGRHLALMSTVIFVAAPLSLFYSRALLAEGLALMCANAMLWCLINGLQKESSSWIAWASVSATIGLLVSPPMMLPTVLLSAALAISHSYRGSSKRFWLIMIVPFLLFGAWQSYSMISTTNIVSSAKAVSPWTDLAPDYQAGGGRWNWWTTILVSRLNQGDWLTLLHRLLYRAGGPVSAALGIVGLMASFRSGPWVVRAWLCADLIGIAVFWKLHLEFESYQLSLVPGLALAAAVGLRAIVVEFPRRWQAMACALILIAVGGQQIWTAERAYYNLPKRSGPISTFFESSGESQTLIVVAVARDRSVGERLLEEGGRLGWTVPFDSLNQNTLSAFLRQGARRLLLVNSGLGERLPPQVAASVISAQSIPNGPDLLMLELSDESIAMYPE